MRYRQFGSGEANIIATCLSFWEGIQQTSKALPIPISVLLSTALLFISSPQKVLLIFATLCQFSCLSLTRLISQWCLGNHPSSDISGLGVSQNHWWCGGTRTVYFYYCSKVDQINCFCWCRPPLLIADNYCKTSTNALHWHPHGLEPGKFRQWNEECSGNCTNEAPGRKCACTWWCTAQLKISSGINIHKLRRGKRWIWNESGSSFLSYAIWNFVLFVKRDRWNLEAFAYSS